MFLQQVVKYMIMAPERPTVTARFSVVQTSGNLQFSAKVLKFGILSQRQLPVHLPFLLLGKRCLNFHLNNPELAKPNSRSINFFYKY